MLKKRTVLLNKSFNRSFSFGNFFDNRFKEVENPKKNELRIQTYFNDHLGNILTTNNGAVYDNKKDHYSGKW